MTHSIAWSTLCIATRENTSEVLLMRRFQLVADDLEDRVYEGGVGLQLDQGLAPADYQVMALERVLSYARTQQATVIINTEKDLTQMEPYLQGVVAAFGERLRD